MKNKKIPENEQPSLYNYRNKFKKRKLQSEEEPSKKALFFFTLTNKQRAFVHSRFNFLSLCSQEWRILLLLFGHSIIIIIKISCSAWT